MKKIILVLILAGFTSLAFGQVKEEKLKEVEVLGLHFKYLDAVNRNESSTVVKNLHKEVGNFDIVETDIYDKNIDNYNFKFRIPNGNILASYDSEGTLLWTVEKFKNTKLPYDLAKKIGIEYPGWTFDKVFYSVNYHHNSGTVKKYRVIISKDGKKKRVNMKLDNEAL